MSMPAKVCGIDIEVSMVRPKLSSCLPDETARRSRSGAHRRGRMPDPSLKMKET